MEHNLVVVYEDRVPGGILGVIHRLGARGFKVFNIYVVSPKEKPFYLEDLRHLIQGVIAYSLRIMHAGSMPRDLGRLAERLPPENTTYVLASPSNGYREILERLGVRGVEIVGVGRHGLRGSAHN